ncbi:MAG TPA: hypothetical protein QF353_06405 [Gammaproteobacteria bacterium]|nr:hypothetical protein [Gammaproteobacteria bacterium]
MKFTQKILGYLDQKEAEYRQELDNNLEGILRELRVLSEAGQGGGENTLDPWKTKLIEQYSSFCREAKMSCMDNSQKGYQVDLADIQAIQRTTLTLMIDMASTFSECRTSRYQVKLEKYKCQESMFNLTRVLDGVTKSEVIADDSLALFNQTQALDPYLTTPDKPKPMDTATYTGLMFAAKVMSMFHQNLTLFVQELMNIEPPKDYVRSTNLKSLTASPCSVAQALSPPRGRYQRSLFTPEDTPSAGLSQKGSLERSMLDRATL